MEWELGFVVALLLTHGIGHSLGLFPVFGWARAPNPDWLKTANQGWSSRSWLIKNTELAKVLALLIWAIATLAFVGAALGLLGMPYLKNLWQLLALSGAIISLAGLILYHQAFPATFNKLGAIAVDLLVLYGLLIARWTPALAR